MIRSMTGFARADIGTDTGQVRWELRSVNHRYLDLQFRLPDGLRELEPELRAILGKTIRRGKVDASLNIRLNRGPGSESRLNIELAREVIRRCETLASEMEQAAPVDPGTILRWPGVVEELEPDLGSVAPIVQQALEQAAVELCDMRAREGDRIQALIESRCNDILRIVAAVQARLPDVLREIRSKLAERIQALDVQPDPERLEQELAMLAQKLDVSEELDRLVAHVGEVREALESDEPVGRRLDFLMQELNREANTLASKSADAETTRHAVDLKVVVEQMREQVQNVE
ncbi:MAG TPA: YicC family protein [Chromatiales bacterium]|nr:YicC family protein [Chromatiales bacterium]